MKILIQGRTKEWKPEDDVNLHDGLRKFGKNWIAIGEAMGKKDLWQIKSRVRMLWLHLRFHPDDKNIDILDILKGAKPEEIPFTEEEKDKIVEGHISFGKDFERIETYIKRSKSKWAIRQYILDITSEDLEK